jgi:urease accessory protein
VIASSTRRRSQGAQLHLERDAAGRTYIARQFAPYPFHFCRPFYVAGDPSGLATVYAQSCAGGVFQHDRLRFRVSVGEGAQCHVTTSAATVVHGMNGGHATQEVTIEAGKGAFVEYVPDPLILFPESRFRSSLELRFSEDACAIVSDSFLSHDPAGARRAFDWFAAEVMIRSEAGRVLVRDRYRLDGASVLDCAGVMDRYAAQGGMFIVTPGDGREELLSRLRADIGAVPGVYAGASLLPSAAGVFVRLLAEDGNALRTAMAQAWQVAREALTGRRPGPRRK